MKKIEQLVKEWFNLMPANVTCGIIDCDESFDVYAFTSEFPYGEMDENGVRLPACEEVDGQIHIPHWFSLMHLFTGDMKGNELEKQMKDIFRVVCCMDQNTFTCYGPPSCMRYSGTPLNETLICLHQILPKFKKEKGLQKVQCIIPVSYTHLTLPTKA